jgi:hypothetical protein
MSDKYTWRDGWGLTFHKASPNESTKVVKEPITRCDKDGNYLYNGEPCLICRLLEGEK